MDDFFGAYMADEGRFEANFSALHAARSSYWSTVDLTGLLDGYAGQPFIDEDHYTPQVNLLIAREMFTAVRDDLKELGP